MGGGVEIEGGAKSLHIHRSTDTGRGKGVESQPSEILIERNPSDRVILRSTDEFLEVSLFVFLSPRDITLCSQVSALHVGECLIINYRHCGQINRTETSCFF